MDFSDIYYEGGQSLVTVKANADVYNTFEAINKPDVTVGAQVGSIQMDLAQENSPEADIIGLPKVTDIISELLTGKMDAAYIETDVAVSYQRNYPDLEIVLDVPYDVSGSSIGVCKGNEGLLAAVNASIAKALEDGSIEITGKILTALDGEAFDSTKQLGLWSLVPAEKADCYRKATIEVIAASQVVRKYTFPNAFVVD